MTPQDAKKAADMLNTIIGVGYCFAVFLAVLPVNDSAGALAPHSAHSQPIEHVSPARARATTEGRAPQRARRREREAACEGGGRGRLMHGRIRIHIALQLVRLH